ncbi:putative protein SSX6 [Phyllostomus hastatus]|uniref:putative protein SSX6 n=1 Tax=Phyllostomus hastatus TaxID=9423 RepID=UPI001E67F886|nr:putative protein SSX6 [Phyllostomus hastatus]
MNQPFTTASLLPRTFGLVTGETQAVSLQGQMIPTAMNTGSSSAKKTMEGKVKSEEKCKAFVDICKYFSEEQWAKLGNSEKITHVYMKRNYDTMTQLGLRAHLPDFMRPKNQTTKSPEHDSNEDQNPRNQGDPLPVTPDSEPAQKQPYPLGKVSASGEPRKQMPEDVGNRPSGRRLMDPCEGGDIFLSENFINQHIFITGLGKGKTNVWLHRLRERRDPVVYEEISDPEEDDCATQDSQEEDPYVGHGIGQPQEAAAHGGIAEVEHCVFSGEMGQGSEMEQGAYEVEELDEGARSQDQS